MYRKTPPIASTTTQRVAARRFAGQRDENAELADREADARALAERRQREAVEGLYVAQMQATTAIDTVVSGVGRMQLSLGTKPQGTYSYRAYASASALSASSSSESPDVVINSWSVGLRFRDPA